ncbi:TROVE domain-containing protein [Desertivirga arenae]|uniref:TROVE domain-containing protein n=1 Tax=Desertivirga arenae TaxID=2810309 RepID=UPI001A96F917|nr:TROVE domain-containing protein [Pedobacter sp. SYSU D00823]
MIFNILNRKKKPVIVKNHEGEKAFAVNARMELYSLVVTWSLNDSFYEKNEERLLRLRDLIAKNNPLFVAKLALYARHKMYMRSVPLLLITELAKIHSGDNLISQVVPKVVSRADEITELLACYQMMNDRTGVKKLNRLSKQLQKGLSVAFNNFDEYQFAKYNRNTAIKLRDALFLVHPKAKDEAQQLIFDKIVKDDLETPYTWETEFSSLGQQQFANDKVKLKAFKAKWEELINSGKLGYMALLRNLRNILEAGVSYESIRKACEVLSSEKQVANAKQFPFRYLSAYRELLTVSNGFGGEVLEALEKAVQASAINIKGFDPETKVLLACDVSGSMQMPVSAKSKVLLYDVGLMLAMLLQNRCKNVVTGMFGDTWKTIAVSKSNILGSVQEFYRREGEVGYSTNGYLVVQDILNRRVKMDKVMLFTDCQLWNSYGNTHIESLWKRYKSEVAPEAKLYLFDLKGYGNTPVRLEKDSVFMIAGWSDKVFEVLAALEKGDSAVHEIEKMEI